MERRFAWKQERREHVGDRVELEARAEHAQKRSLAPRDQTERTPAAEASVSPSSPGIRLQSARERSQASVNGTTWGHAVNLAAPTRSSSAATARVTAGDRIANSLKAIRFITPLSAIVLCQSRSFCSTRGVITMRTLLSHVEERNPMTLPARPIRLYRYPLSGHSHRVELLLSLLRLPFALVEVDLLKGAHKAPDFLARNPFGQVPVIEDGETTLADSNAILVYLATRYDPSGRWLPREPVTAARVQQWLSVAAGQLAYGPNVARLVTVFGVRLDHARATAIAADLFGVIDRHLAARRFLVSDEPTIADVAIYTYTAHAPEGGVPLEPYRSVRAWLARMEALPGFLPMRQSRFPAAA